MKRIVVLIVAVLVLGANAYAKGVSLGESYLDTVQRYGKASHVKKTQGGTVELAVFQQGVVMIGVGYRSGRASLIIYGMQGSEKLELQVVKEFLCTFAGVSNWPAFNLSKNAWAKKDPVEAAVFTASTRKLTVMDSATIQRVLSRSKKKANP